jgi:hypothetical protein
VRDEYQKAVDQEIEKTEAVWRKCDELINNSRPDLEQAAKGMTDLIYIVDKLNKKIDDVSLWKVEKILELVEKFNKMPETEKQILIKLIQIEGKKDE